MKKKMYVIKIGNLKKKKVKVSDLGVMRDLKIITNEYSKGN